MRQFLVAGVICAAALVPLSLHAAPVEYSTTGIFLSTGTNMLTVGGGDLVFNSLPATTVNAPSNISYGFFDSTGIDGGGNVSDSFQLTITQIMPTGGNSQVLGTLSGFIDFNSSTLRLTFINPTFFIDGIQYTIDQPGNGIPIVPGSSNNGVTTIQGTVSTTVPEPATYFGIGTGLAMIGLGLRRRVRA